MNEVRTDTACVAAASADTEGRRQRRRRLSVPSYHARDSITRQRLALRPQTLSPPCPCPSLRRTVKYDGSGGPTPAHHGDDPICWAWRLIGLSDGWPTWIRGRRSYSPAPPATAVLHAGPELADPNAAVLSVSVWPQAMLGSAETIPGQPSKQPGCSRNRLWGRLLTNAPLSPPKLDPSSASFVQSPTPTHENDARGDRT